MNSKTCLSSIAIFTGTRADYGILRPLISELHSKECDVRLVVSGTHLSPSHGQTITEIENDGFPIHATIPIIQGDLTSLGASRDMGGAVSKFGEYLTGSKPDILVILGDRLEALAMAIACMINGIPVAHIHGGEVTLGAMDDKIRHAITKLSNLHFVATQQYANRVIQMGEDSDTVFNVGALALDNVDAIERDGRVSTLKFLGFESQDRYSLVSYHPAQYEKISTLTQITNIFESLLSIENLKILITGVNSDIGSVNVNQVIEDFARSQPSRIRITKSLGSKRYFDALSHAEFAIGNSSSLVIETPSLGVPAILVGDRQKGRVTSENTVLSDGSKLSITDQIGFVTTESFKSSCAKAKSPYGTPGVANRIVDILLEQKFPFNTQKVFVDN
jgi:UDP-hydrolysing UDP-N-acetyl-D-glucosamine 2-epimerase